MQKATLMSKTLLPLSGCFAPLLPVKCTSSTTSMPVYIRLFAWVCSRLCTLQANITCMDSWAAHISDRSPQTSCGGLSTTGTFQFAFTHSRQTPTSNHIHITPDLIYHAYYSCTEKESRRPSLPPSPNHLDRARPNRSSAPCASCESLPWPPRLKEPLRLLVLRAQVPASTTKATMKRGTTIPSGTPAVERE